jgi:hypothetical protein
MNNHNIKISSNKNFGIVFFVVFFIIGFYPIFKGNDIRLWSVSIAIIFLVLGIINSSILSPLNKLWFKFGLFLGKIVSPIVMGIIFFLVITPTSLLLKLFGKDILNLKKNKSNSYWIEKKGPKSIARNQF